MKLSFFASIFCFVAFIEFAFSSCHPGSVLDLRVKNSQIFNRLPIKDQGEFGLCYSYAATTLIEYFKLKKSYGKKSSLISPVEAALFTSAEIGDEDEEGGQVCDVIRAMSRRGTACAAPTIQDELKYKDLSVYFHREMVSKVFLPYLTRSEVFQKVSTPQFISRSNLNNNQKKYLKRYDNFYKQLIAEMIRRGFTSQNIPDSKEIFIFSQKWHSQNRYILLRDSFIQLLIAHNCSNTISIPQFTCDQKKYHGHLLIDEVEIHLENRQEPLSISFCSAFLKNRKILGLDKEGRVLKTCEPHAAVVIGKRGNPEGRCEYLIRNSWGHYSNYDWKTSSGDVWVDGAILSKNLFGIDIVSPD